MEKLAAAMVLWAACGGIASKILRTYTRAAKAVLFFLCGMKVGQVATIPQRPPKEEAQVGNRNEEMEEEKGARRTGLRSYI